MFHEPQIRRDLLPADKEVAQNNFGDEDKNPFDDIQPEDIESAFLPTTAFDSKLRHEQQGANVVAQVQESEKEPKTKRRNIFRIRF